MHLVHAPNFAPGKPLTIDVRTRVRDWYSYVETAAIKIGNDVLEVSSFGDYFLNGVEGAKMPNSLSGFRVTQAVPEANIHTMEIAIAGNETISVRSFKDMVSVKIHEAHSGRFVGSGGMMGDFLTGDVYSRDGGTMLVDPVAIAREWQVVDDEPMLFQTAQAPQFPETCMMPKKTQSSGRLGKSVALKAAEKACADWSDETKKLCVEDVMRTGDLELARAATM